MTNFKKSASFLLRPYLKGKFAIPLKHIAYNWSFFSNRCLVVNKSLAQREVCCQDGISAEPERIHSIFIWPESGVGNEPITASHRGLKDTVKSLELILFNKNHRK